MTHARFSIPILRTLHLLGISAWIGGGIGILLLLALDCRTESHAELQAFNRVIDAIDDCIIAPGAIITMLSGRVRRPALCPLVPVELRRLCRAVPGRLRPAARFRAAAAHSCPQNPGGRVVVNHCFFLTCINALPGKLRHSRLIR